MAFAHYDKIKKVMKIDGEREPKSHPKIYLWTIRGPTFPENGDRKLENGNWKPENGDREPENGDWEPENGDRWPVSGAGPPSIQRPQCRTPGSPGRPLLLIY